MPRMPFVTLMLVAMPVVGAAQPAELANERALILDSGGQAVVAVDLVTGSIARRASLAGAPELALGSPVGGHLAVFDSGPQKTTFCCGLRPMGPMTVALLDAATLAPLGSIEVGWGVPTKDLGRIHLPMLAGFVVPSPDGRRVTVLCAGYRSKKPEEDLPRELVTFDLGSGQVAGRVAIDRAPDAMWGTADGDGIVLFARASDDHHQSLPAELLFVDLAHQAVAERVPLSGRPLQSLMAPGQRWLYLLDAGSPSNKKDKNVDGVLTVVSVAERRVRGQAPVGSGPRSLVWDEEHQTVLVPSDGPPVEKGRTRGGELHVFLGADQIGVVSLPEEPHLLRLRGSRAYVAGRHTLTVADLDTLRQAAGIPLDHADDLSELVFSRDERRAFGLYEASSRLSIFDVADLRLVGSVTTGRGGVKLAKTLGAVALSVAATTASYYQGQSVAMTQNSSWFTYNIYNFGVAAPESSVVVSPDGRTAFALNTQSNDVTIVDVETAAVISKEAAKGRSLAAFPNGRRFAVLGKNEMRLFDVESHQPAPPLHFDDAGAVSLVFTKDGRTAIAYGGKSLYLLDAETGAVRAQVPGLLSVKAVLLE